MKTLGTRISSVAMSIVLVIGLCPGLAYANDLQYGTLADDVAMSASSIPTNTQEESDFVENHILVDGEALPGDDIAKRPYTGSAIPLSVTIDTSSEPGYILVAGTDYNVSFISETTGQPVSAPNDMGFYRILIEGIGEQHVGWLCERARLLVYCTTADQFASYVNSIQIPEEMNPEAIEQAQKALMAVQPMYELLDEGEKAAAEAARTQAAQLSTQLSRFKQIFLVDYTVNGEAIDKNTFPAEGLVFEYDADNPQVQTLDIALQDGTTPLVPDQDYTVTCYTAESYYSLGQDPVEAELRNIGQYVIVIRGIGDTYYGEFTFPVEIKAPKRMLTDDAVSVVWNEDNYAAYREGGLPDVSGLVTSVKYGDDTLGADRDYQLVIRDADGNAPESVPVSDGVYFVHIVGLGSYAGSEYPTSRAINVQDPYELTQWITVDSYEFPYTGYIPDAHDSYSFTNGRLTGDNDILYGDAFTVTYKTADGLEDATPILPGEYQVVFTGVSPYHGTIAIPCTITALTDLKDAKVNVNSLMDYTGNPLKPLSVTLSGTTLTEGTDYTVTYYEQDDPETPLTQLIDPGTYTFTITSANTTLSGSQSGGPIKVVANPENDFDNAIVKIAGQLAIDGHEAVLYAGAEGVDPEIKVILDNTELEEASDYTYTWAHDGAPHHGVLTPSESAYTLTVTPAKVGYTGSITATAVVHSTSNIANAQLQITNATNMLTTGIAQFDPAGVAVSVEASLTLDGQVIDPAHYRLEYAPYPSDGTHPAADTLSWSADAPEARGLYRLRAVALPGADVNVFGTCAGSDESPVLFRIADYRELANATVVSVAPAAYTGSAVSPAIALQFEGVPLVQGRDFAITGYKDAQGNTISAAIAPGSYKAVLAGKDPYSGQIEVAFEIARTTSLERAVIEYDDTLVYTGSALYPTLSITLDGVELVKDTDYTVESVGLLSTGVIFNGEPVNIGSYRMTLKGVETRGVTGTRNVDFRIIGANDLSNASITFTNATGDATFEHTGSAIVPQIEVKVGDKTLTETQDYTLKFYRYYDTTTTLVTTCTDVGRYQVRITGQGDYAGSSAVKDFAIVPASQNLGSASIYVTDAAGEDALLAETYGYTGKDVLAGGIKLKVEDNEVDSTTYTATVKNEKGDVVASAVYPGSYTVEIASYGITAQSKSFTITAPSQTVGTVEASGTALVDNADASKGEEVKLYVEDKQLASENELTKRMLTASDGADYRTVYDVQLALLDSNDEIEGYLTQDFGSITLSFDVGTEHNGKAARIVQVHKNADTTYSLVDHPLTRVVNGKATTTVNSLSEFVVVVGDVAANMKVTEYDTVDRPVGKTFTYDGKTHAGAEPHDGYTLSGTVSASAAGTYTVTATLNQGYKWSDTTSAPYTFTWKIEEADDPDPGPGPDDPTPDDPDPDKPVALEGATVAIAGSPYIYTGSSIMPAASSISVTANGTTVPASAYTYKVVGNNIEPGTVTVEITASAAGYTGKATGTFTIEKAKLASVTLEKDNFTYDGTAKEPKATVKANNNKTLIEDEDYELTYSNNTAVGTATVTATGIGNHYTGTLSATFTINPIPTLEVYSGSDRYATARMIAQEAASASNKAYKGIIVVSGAENRFADALSAAGLSGLTGYPLVIVNGEGLTKNDKASLSTMKSSANGKLDILIVGGTAAVSSGVAKKLAEYGTVKKRISGDDRYATNEAVYVYGRSVSGGWNTDTTFIATGANFPDALSIAPYLVASKSPILLVRPNAKTLPGGEALKAISSAKKVIALGGTSAVTNQFLTAAKNATANKSYERLTGTHRYETSANIVAWELKHGMTTDGLGVATGANFPDALACGYLLGKAGSVLCLVNSEKGKESENAKMKSTLEGIDAPSNKVRIFGGTSAVSQEIRQMVVDALNGAVIEEHDDDEDHDHDHDHDGETIGSKTNWNTYDIVTK